MKENFRKGLNTVLEDFTEKTDLITIAAESLIKKLIKCSFTMQDTIIINILSLKIKLFLTLKRRTRLSPKLK